MKLFLQQRFFSWRDSYEIFDEDGDVVYTVKAQFAWGHCLRIYDVDGNNIGAVKEIYPSWLPKFELYQYEQYIGCVSRELSLLQPRYDIDCYGWQVEGDLLAWNYRITDFDGQWVATVSKELWNWTDTYAIKVANPSNTLTVLMLALAIDADGCSKFD